MSTPDIAKVHPAPSPTSSPARSHREVRWGLRPTPSRAERLRRRQRRHRSLVSGDH